MKISIVTGPVHSGKTTFLQKLLEKRNDVAGILSPEINDIRYFKNVLNGEMIPMKTTIDDANAFKIGRFIFTKSSFEWASEIVESACNKQANVVVVDEIGPLELQEYGFAKLLKNILKKEDFKGELILVIREKILDDVLNFFNIKKENVNFINWK